MTISSFALKGELIAKILLFRFFLLGIQFTIFIRVYFRMNKLFTGESRRGSQELESSYGFLKTMNNVVMANLGMPQNYPTSSSCVRVVL